MKKNIYMKRLSVLFLSILFMGMFTNSSAAQGSDGILTPIEWSFDSKDLGNGEYELQFTAKIEDKWHLYSQHIPGDDGPQPTSFEFEASDKYELIGSVEEPTPEEEYDNNFSMMLKYFSHNVTFTQKIKATGSENFTVKGLVMYMSCDDTRCLPPSDVEFSFNLGGSETASEPASGILEPVKWTTEVNSIGENKYEIIMNAKIDKGYHLYTQEQLEDGPLATFIEFTENSAFTLVGKPKETMEAHVEFDKIFNANIASYDGEAQFVQVIELKENEELTLTGYIEYQVCNDVGCLFLTEDVEIKVSPEKETSWASLWAVIIEAIIWGFAALLTPCVFPMVPMTVSFFMKGGENKAKGRIMASTFGVSIVALYTLPIAAIILITYAFGGDSVTSDIFNWISTHWIPNIIFFLIFMIFAASFFGAFEIVLPSRLVNRADSGVDKGGLTGAFFMALTLVLVSFSCTGPIVGSIIVKSTSGEIWEPIITMIAFSTAFALPFTLFAFFPSWLNNLPKSGGWLNSVKVVLGFIEVALGLKFLSMADQTYHWGILDREVYLAIWIITFALLGLYLLGKLKFKHDSDMPYLGVGRLFLAIITFSFVMYMIPGMWGAPLKALSGYLPPQTTIDFDIDKIVRDNVKTISVSGVASSDEAQTPKSQTCSEPKYADFLHLPHGLDGYYDYNQALECAKEQGKPLFIDFTGHACVNCREMESNVWSDPEVLKRLRNDFVVVALYVDDKKKLPKEEWVVSTYDGKTKKSIGKVNADIQVSKYRQNAQPFYVVEGMEGEQLGDNHSYDKDVQKFIKFLDKAKAEYEAKYK
jgi:thiol:disulfide interchange protein DsbD